MTYNSKLNEKVNKLEKVFNGCIVCGVSIGFPFKTQNYNNKVLRCKKHQKEFKNFWFDDYQEYIKIFRGQL